MEIVRGDVVVALLPGDYGKGRPALIVQSDAYNLTHASIVVCPITSHLVGTSLFRILVNPRTVTGFETVSEIMVDKVTAIKRERIAKLIGRLDSSVMNLVDRALRQWLQID